MAGAGGREPFTYWSLLLLHPAGRNQLMWLSPDTGNTYDFDAAMVLQKTEERRKELPVMQTDGWGMGSNVFHTLVTHT